MPIFLCILRKSADWYFSLDFAKMSKSKDNVKSDTGRKASLVSDLDVNRSSLVDLSDLAETVVEGILVGHHYRKATLDSSVFVDIQRQDSKSHTTESKTGPENVMIILTIDWQASWFFNSQIGGWKRILMNLFGNALKYTDSGFVHISLRANPSEPNSNSDRKTNVTLHIEDSGRGMSREYQKYELYTPFAQEDPLSTGTGLGLSIVRQLVTDLGGSVDIQSELGQGTMARVSVPLIASTEPSEAAVHSLLSNTRSKCKGLSLCLVGFDVFPDLSETPTGILSVHARRMMALKSSITAFAMDWFGMEVKAASSLASAEGDIFIGLQSQFETSQSNLKTKPLILFEDVKTESRVQDYGVFRLPQPLVYFLGPCVIYWGLDLFEATIAPFSNRRFLVTLFIQVIV